MKERRQLRKRLFDELLQRTGYISRDELGDELTDQFGLRMTGKQITSRLRVDRNTVFTEQEFLAIIQAFTCHFNFKGRITAFEALLLWGWSDELPRQFLVELRQIWSSANQLAEFETAYSVYTQWDIYTDGMDWFDPQKRRMIQARLRSQQSQQYRFDLAPNLSSENKSIQISEVLEHMQELRARQHFTRLADVYRKHEQQIYSAAITAQTSIYFDLLSDIAHYLVETGDIQLAHRVVENMTDLAFASEQIPEAQRKQISVFEVSEHELLKARALLYQSYWFLQDTRMLSAGLHYVEEAYSYYQSVGHAYGQTDALNRMSLYLRKMGNFHESILRLSYAKDTALQIRTPRDRFDWLTMIRAAEAFTAFQFVQDKREPYVRFLGVGEFFPSKYAQIDYQFALATMTYQLGDAKNAQLYGQAAEEDARQSRIKFPLSESHHQWRMIAIQNGWHKDTSE